jgi:hypothetical protein
MADYSICCNMISPVAVAEFEWPTVWQAICQRLSNEATQIQDLQRERRRQSRRDRRTAKNLALAGVDVIAAGAAAAASCSRFSSPSCKSSGSSARHSRGAVPLLNRLGGSLQLQPGLGLKHSIRSVAVAPSRSLGRYRGAIHDDTAIAISIAIAAEDRQDGGLAGAVGFDLLARKHISPTAANAIPRPVSNRVLYGLGVSNLAWESRQRR